MTHDPVLHALADFCQWIEKNGMAGPASKPYESALKVLRDHVAPSGEREYVSREEIINSCLLAVQGERLTDPVEGSEGDDAYNRAVRHCECAIVKLLSISRDISK